IGDLEHADVYNSTITKRENKIAELEQKIADNQKYNEVSRQKRDSLKSTSELLDEIISSGHISDANLRMLINKVYIYNDEDGGVDVVAEFNGEFNHI
ncbi:MAG: hypothetical protein HDR72_02530, partial [Ruminococcaceae bacterium]|nr:hypothetical protein [Oscillospiraceae bacterium]